MIMRKKFFVTIALPFFLLGCNKDETKYVYNETPPSEEPVVLKERKDIQLTRAEQEFVQENNGFALELFKKVSGLANGGSTVISPLSVTIDFGMVNNGASGETRDEINKVLGYKEGSVEALNSFCQSILKQSSEVDPSTTIGIGNAAVVNKSRVALNDGFTKTIQSAYGAEVIYKEFGKDDVMGLINSWCDKNTNGMIPKILDQQPSASEYANFLNAVYFKGNWSNKFESPRSEDFTLEDGNRIKVKMMWKEGAFGCADIPGIGRYLQVPYGNQAYKMIFLLPEADKTIGEVKDSLNREIWSSMVKAIAPADVDVKIPVFETETGVLHLKEALMEMGIKKAFVSGEADFSGMTKDAITISDVLHKARIKVDEKGTEAAAVTVIKGDTSAGGPSAPPQPRVFHADRPFIYAITEVSTGAIFFIGQYTGK